MNAWPLAGHSSFYGVIHMAKEEIKSNMERLAILIAAALAKVWVRGQQAQHQEQNAPLPKSSNQ